MVDAGSPSLAHPDYWWYRVRTQLLQVVMQEHVQAGDRILDVGSADGPSVDWLRRLGRRTSMDVDPRGLGPGDVCGSAEAMPFASDSFDVVAAFDVIEHCEDERAALREVGRVLKPGGRFLMSVPAYEWAWTHFDDHNHHHRRYTRARARDAVRAAGLEVVRTTHAFSGTFPLFAADRLRTRLSQRGSAAPVLAPDEVPGLPQVGRALEALFERLSDLDRRLLRGHDLAVGSSVFLVARKPVVAPSTRAGAPSPAVVRPVPVGTADKVAVLV